MIAIHPSVLLSIHLPSKYSAAHCLSSPILTHAEPHFQVSLKFLRAHSACCLQSSFVILLVCTRGRCPRTAPNHSTSCNRGRDEGAKQTDLSEGAKEKGEKAGQLKGEKEKDSSREWGKRRDRKKRKTIRKRISETFPFWTKICLELHLPSQPHWN